MARKVIWLGILAIVLVFGIAVLGCADDPTNDDGTFTLTNIPSKYNGNYAMYMVEDDPILIGAENINMNTEVVTLVQINKGNVSLPMWTLNQSDQIVRYTGNYTTTAGFGGVIISNISTFDFKDDTDFIAQISFHSFSFANGSATKSANDGTIFEF